MTNREVVRCVASELISATVMGISLVLAVVVLFAWLR